MDRSCCDLKIDMSSSIKYYKNQLHAFGIDENLLPVIVGVFVIILTAVVWKLLFGKKSKRNGVLLVGVSDAGKTSLFAQLISGQSKETLTSLKENEAVYAPDNQKTMPLSLIDIPGQESIRGRVFDNFKDQARGLLFIVDSETFQKNLKDVAEFLFQILTDRTVNKISPAVCIACNKQDLLKSKSKRVIQNQLENELNTLRKTQSAALTSTAGGDNDSVFLGVKGEDFKFQHLPKLQVEFVECVTKSNDDAELNLDEIKLWISSLV